MAIDPAGTTVMATGVGAENGALHINVADLAHGPKARLALEVGRADTDTQDGQYCPVYHIVRAARPGQSAS